MELAYWEKVCAVFDEVVDLSGTERERRLMTIGASDPELRDTVAALLQGDAAADALLGPIESLSRSAASREGNGEQSADDVRARLQSALGGAYDIDRELTGGGMSCVFLAQERAVRRKVVIKVLRPELAGAFSAKRFQREILFAAGLQHPHILPLLSAGEAGGLLYYTMPFVDGESLRARLSREGELPVADVIRIMRDVASALAHAHRRGLVHRDIKPENVLMSDGGAVVADFGIAKALSASSLPSTGGSAATTLTERGLVLGTPVYMAPEQALGDTMTDHRTDLYALGVMAYEMLAGRPPFEGRSLPYLVAAHAARPPRPVLQLRPSTPEWLATLVMRCLEKRPADRPRDAQEMLLLLDRAAAQDAAVGGATPRNPLRAARVATWRGRGVPLAFAGTLVAVLSIALAAFALRREDPAAAPVWLDVAVPDSASAHVSGFAPITLSPDGSRIGFVGGPRNALFVRSLEDREGLRRVDGSDGASCPSFSPDGEWILFTADGHLLRAPVRGGVPVVVVDSTVDPCAVWIDQKQVLFTRNGSFFLVRADGGPQTHLGRFANFDANRDLAVSPSQVLPGGASVLVFLREPHFGATWELGVLTLRDGKLLRLGKTGVTPRYVAGYLLYGGQYGARGVFATPFSLPSLRFTGPERQLLSSTLHFTTSDNGRLAYLETREGLEAWRSLVAVTSGGYARPISGRSSGSAAAASMSGTRLDSAPYAWPRLSPDGKRVALELRETIPTAWDVWVYDIPSHQLRRLTDHVSGLRPAGWTPDSRSVVFLAPDSANPSSTYRVVTEVWDGSAPPRELVRLPVAVHTFTAGPSHGYGAFSTYDPVGAFASGEIWTAPLDTPSAARRFIATKGFASEPRLSHDGQLLAYTSDQTGRNEVFIRPLHGSEGEVQVSEGGGAQPVWAPNDRSLYYRGPSHMMRASISHVPHIGVSRRDVLFEDLYERHDMTDYDVFPNGKELLMIQANRGNLSLGIVMNWPALLSQRAQAH